jgi:2-polyprenyl-6-methoxyphenol hydroxylase-like FAD-dependent oxidoreductase
MTHPVQHERYDVVIAGARCAGASTALLLARAGLRVLVVDPLPRGRDTLSTHALMRGAVLQLHRWGLLDQIQKAGTPALRVTTFDYADETISVPIKARSGVDALYAPRRTVLDPILVDAAEAAGAEVVHGLRVDALTGDASGRVTGAWLQDPEGRYRVQADLVIGADGLRSPVARMVGAPLLHRAEHATASIYGYWRGLPADEYRWYFREATGAGVIPTNGDAACIFVSVPPDSLKALRGDALDGVFHGAVQRVDPELAGRLSPELQAGGLRAFGGVQGFLRQSWGAGWALAGDAGYFRDPLTAHGISDALRDAELLARAVVRGGDDAMREYQDTRDGVARELMAVTDRIASLDWTTDEVKALHHRLSRAMNAGTDLIEGWDGEAISTVHAPAA